MVIISVKFTNGRPCTQRLRAGRDRRLSLSLSNGPGSLQTLREDPSTEVMPEVETVPGQEMPFLQLVQYLKKCYQLLNTRQYLPLHRRNSDFWLLLKRNKGEISTLQVTLHSVWEQLATLGTVCFQFPAVPTGPSGLANKKFSVTCLLSLFLFPSLLKSKAPLHAQNVLKVGK